MENILRSTERFKDCPDKVLGVQAMNPLNSGVSGSRATLLSMQKGHSMSLINPQSPYIISGYENRYAEKCSSTVDSDGTKEVLAIIPKFLDNPQHHYYVIVQDMLTEKIEVIERVSYVWTSEEYGYLNDCRYIDRMEPGSVIKPGDPIKRSTMYDENGIRADTVNLRTIYQACDETNEDAIKLSVSAAKKSAVPLFDKVTITLNNNDIPTNMFGDVNTIKSFPWINEKTNNGILMAIRRDVREESLRTQTSEAMRRILKSDIVYSSDCDTVIDFDIYCNNIEELVKKGANTQIIEAYNRRMEFVNRFVTVVTEIVSNPNRHNTGMSYELSELYDKFSKESRGELVDRDNSGRDFKGTILKFMLMHVHYPCKGDKFANRFGGKGVISEIVPDELMPVDEFGEHVECIMNQGTSGNRLNPAQNKELSINMCSRQILKWLSSVWDPAKNDDDPNPDPTRLSTEECYWEIHKFLDILSPEMAKEFADMYYDTIIKATYEEHADINEYAELFLQNMIDNEVIQISLKPLEDVITLDSIEKIYDAFECCHQMYCWWLKPNCKGKLVPFPMFGARSVGHVAYIVLKQYAKEKYSAVCLANTNMRNTNTRSKSAKNNTTPFRDTPIMFGNMESGDFAHASMEEVINLLMVHSVSPQTRMQVETMYTCDPYDVNIEITAESTNRSVEIIDDYFKEMGFRINFVSVQKEYEPDAHKLFQWDFTSQTWNWDFSNIEDYAKDWTKPSEDLVADTFKWSFE